MYYRAVDDPGDIEARSEMHLASSFAGIGLGMLVFTFGKNTNIMLLLMKVFSLTESNLLILEK